MITRFYSKKITVVSDVGKRMLRTNMLQPGYRHRQCRISIQLLENQIGEEEKKGLSIIRQKPTISDITFYMNYLEINILTKFAHEKYVSVLGYTDNITDIAIKMITLF